MNSKKIFKFFDNYEENTVESRIKENLFSILGKNSTLKTLPKKQ